MAHWGGGWLCGVLEIHDGGGNDDLALGVGCGSMFVVCISCALKNTMSHADG